MEPASEEMLPVASASNLRVQFKVGPAREILRAVDGVSFDVGDGEVFGVIGESGSGKSTLGRALLCLEPHVSGHVLHEGRNPLQMNAADRQIDQRKFQIVFQDPNSSLNPRMTILRSVREPLDIHGIDPPGGRHAAVIEMLSRVGLAGSFAQRYPHELSGGQKQRVNIARALILRPRLIVCDEVVASLDVSIQADVLNLFLELKQDFGFSYLFITHDLGVVSHISDRVAVMYLGRFVELAPAGVLNTKPRHPYTRALLDAEPTPGRGRQSSRIRLQGETPNAISPPSGCRFRTRCPFVTQLCVEQEPLWREIGTLHWVSCHHADRLDLSVDKPAALADAPTQKSDKGEPSC